MLSRFSKRLAGTPEVNTTLHITHAKAGSTWVDALLRQLFPRRVAERGHLSAADTDGNLDKYSFERGRIYPAIFMTRDQGYEDLLRSAQKIFEDVLIRKFQLPVVPAELARALKQVGFEKVFGRKLGDEDVNSHGRRGLPGDWKNRFTAKLRERFAERYGDVLIKTGYETDSRWVRG